MSDLIERYFDGGWVKYVLALWVGAAVQRFLVTPGSDANDAIAFTIGLAIIALAMGLCWINTRAESPPVKVRRT